MRLSGLLPPFPISKRIGQRTGATYVWGIRFGRFDVLPLADGSYAFDYRMWPIRDVVTWDAAAGRWSGPGLLLGRRFCVFRLDP